MEKFQLDMLNVLIEQGEKCKKTNNYGQNLKYIDGDNFYKWMDNCYVFLNKYFPNETITKTISKTYRSLGVYETTFNGYIEELCRLRDRI